MAEQNNVVFKKPKAKKRVAVKALKTVSIHDRSFLDETNIKWFRQSELEFNFRSHSFLGEGGFGKVIKGNLRKESGK